jgi:hypothetical protein
VRNIEGPFAGWDQSVVDKVRGIKAKKQEEAVGMRHELEERSLPPMRSPILSVVWSTVQIVIGIAWFSVR